MKNLSPHLITLPFAHPELIGQPLLSFGAFNMVEVWKQIKDYTNYEVSNFGRVKSNNLNKHKNSIILKQHIKTTGYYFVVVCKEGIRKHFMIHRLLSFSFIPNPENKKYINHINGNRLDNSLSNLEWCTSSENNKHAYSKNGKKPYWKGKYGNEHHKSKITYQYNKNYILLNTYESYSDAKLKTGINNIEKCCAGTIKHAGGFIWSYKKLN